MPRDRYDDEDDDEDEDWSDGDDEYDPEDPETYPPGVYADDDPATIPCPYCKREILEDAERCPHCEHYLSREDAPAASKSGCWIVLMILALLAAMIWVVG